MRGGVTFFRSGGGAAARAYLEADHARADDYYLAEGTGLADRIVYARDEAGASLEASRDVLDGDAYEAWVDWKDPVTGQVRGTPRERRTFDPYTGEQVVTATSPRFAEMTVNADKSLSIAAAVNPEVSAALDVAMRDAAEAMTAYLAEHSVTRIGPLGAQRLVAVDRFESAYVMHQTSRAGDPHRHAHLQFSTRVRAAGKWRALDTATTLRQQGALRGIGEATINAHPQLREALAKAGFTFDPATGKVVELEQFSAGMSKRAEQVAANRDRLEAAWRAEHPGQTPGPAMIRAWDRRAWDLDRPNKKPTELSTVERWVAELRGEGFTPPTASVPMDRIAIADLDRDALAAQAVERAAAAKSAWSVADLTDQAGHLVAASGVVAGRSELAELVEDITARATGASITLADLEEERMPETLRHLTSRHVLEVDGEIHARLATRALTPGADAEIPDTLTVDGRQVEGAQRDAVAMMAGTHQVVVFEGAAGAGKTTALKAARELLHAQGREQLIVAPTLKAAQEAGKAVGADADSLHSLLRGHGWRWTDEGTWYRLAKPGAVDHDGNTWNGVPARFRLTARHQVVVDEAGMVDQEAGRALLTVLDESGASLVLAGDRAQKSQVGRGGFFDAAAQRAHAVVDVDQVHRFLDSNGNIDQAYADLSLQLRGRENPAQVFDQLVARGLVHVHATIEDAQAAIATATVEQLQDSRAVAVTAATNDEATGLNAATRARLVDAGVVDDTRTAHGVDGLPIGRGDQIMTRENDRTVGVANRERFTVTKVHPDGRLTVASEDRRRHTLPAKYVAENVHLAYAVTDYGNQGATTPTAHTFHGDGIAADGQYVGLTRGRYANHVHLIAVDLDDARRQFVDASARDTADRGLDDARTALIEQTKGLDLTLPENPYLVDQPAPRPQPEPRPSQQPAPEPSTEEQNRNATRDRLAAAIEQRAEQIQVDRAAAAAAEQRRAEQIEKLRGIFDGSTRRLTPEIEQERERLVEEAREAREALQRRQIQNAHQKAVNERRAEWVEKGLPMPEQTRQALTVAEARLRDATTALEAQQARHERQVRDVTDEARAEAGQAARRVIDAEQQVRQANVFTRGRAREALDQVRADVSEQYGLPVPENPAQLFNNVGGRGAWVDQIAARRGAEADARTDPQLEQARTDREHAATDHDLATVQDQGTRTRYEAEVIRPDDDLTRLARSAAHREQYPAIRESTAQLRKDAEQARDAVTRFDNAPVDEQARIARRNNTIRLHDAEQQYQRDHGHHYDPPTPQHRGPSLGR